MLRAWQPRRHHADWVVLTFLALAAGIYAYAGQLWPVLAHILAFRLILFLRSHPRYAWAHLVYPAALVPFLYKELGPLNRIVAGRFYDQLVESWDYALFGSSPAMWLCEKFCFLPLSELLHLAYVAYHLMLPILVAWLILARRIERVHQVLFVCLATLVSCYVCAIPFPVEGPRLTYPPMPPELHGPVWHFCHHWMMRGAADGAAFPSGHVSLSWIVALCSRRLARPLSWLMIPWAVLVTVATVYGRFHYAVDALAGAAVALAYWRFLAPPREERQAVADLR